MWAFSSHLRSRHQGSKAVQGSGVGAAPLEASDAERVLQLVDWAHVSLNSSTQKL